MVLLASIVVAGIMQAIPCFYTIFIKGGVGRNGSTVAVSKYILSVKQIG